jgi:hypothetical protein
VASVACTSGSGVSEWLSLAHAASVATMQNAMSKAKNLRIGKSPLRRFVLILIF